MDIPVLLRGDLVIESLAPSFGEFDDNPHGVAEGGVADVQAVLDDRYAWLTGESSSASARRRSASCSPSSPPPAQPR